MRAAHARQHERAVALVSVLLTVAVTDSALADPPGLTPTIAPPQLSDAVVIAATSSTQVDPSPSDPLNTAPFRARDSYTPEIVAVDGFLLGAATLGTTLWVGQGPNSSAGGVLALAAIPAWFLATPIIHGFHHHGGRAFGSLALRVALPLLGAFVGASLDNSDDVPLGGMMVGSLVGAITATCIDAAIAHEPAWSPTIMPTTHGGMALGVARSW